MSETAYMNRTRSLKDLLVFTKKKSNGPLDSHDVPNTAPANPATGTEGGFARAASIKDIFRPKNSKEALHNNNNNSHNISSSNFIRNMSKSRMDSQQQGSSTAGIIRNLSGKKRTSAPAVVSGLGGPPNGGYSAIPRGMENDISVIRDKDIIHQRRSSCTSDTAMTRAGSNKDLFKPSSKKNVDPATTAAPAAPIGTVAGEPVFESKRKSSTAASSSSRSQNQAEQNGMGERSVSAKAFTALLRSGSSKKTLSTASTSSKINIVNADLAEEPVLAFSNFSYAWNKLSDPVVLLHDSVRYELMDFYIVKSYMESMRDYLRPLDIDEFKAWFQVFIAYIQFYIDFEIDYLLPYTFKKVPPSMKRYEPKFNQRNDELADKLTIVKDRFSKIIYRDDNSKLFNFFTRVDMFCRALSFHLLDQDGRTVAALSRQLMMNKDDEILRDAATYCIKFFDYHSMGIPMMVRCLKDKEHELRWVKEYVPKSTYMQYRTDRMALESCHLNYINMFIARKHKHPNQIRVEQKSTLYRKARSQSITYLELVFGQPHGLAENFKIPKFQDIRPGGSAAPDEEEPRENFSNKAFYGDYREYSAGFILDSVESPVKNRTYFIQHDQELSSSLKNVTFIDDTNFHSTHEEGPSIDRSSSKKKVSFKSLNVQQLPEE